VTSRPIPRACEERSRRPPFEPSASEDIPHQQRHHICASSAVVRGTMHRVFAVRRARRSGWFSIATADGDWGNAATPATVRLINAGTSQSGASTPTHQHQH
jgi:hypothetical protein